MCPNCGWHSTCCCWLEHFNLCGTSPLRLDTADPWRKFLELAQSRSGSKDLISTTISCYRCDEFNFLYSLRPWDIPSIKDINLILHSCQRVNLQKTIFADWAHSCRRYQELQKSGVSYLLMGKLIHLLISNHYKDSFFFEYISLERKIPKDYRGWLKQVGKVQMRYPRIGHLEKGVPERREQNRSALIEQYAYAWTTPGKTAFPLSERRSFRVKSWYPWRRQKSLLPTGIGTRDLLSIK